MAPPLSSPARVTFQIQASLLHDFTKFTGELRILLGPDHNNRRRISSTHKVGTNNKRSRFGCVLLKRFQFLIGLLLICGYVPALGTVVALASIHSADCAC
jgi:hypothetical protein